MKIKYVADKLHARRRFVRNNFPKTNVIDDADIIFGDDSISVVVIATPVESHYHLAQKALLSNKHIFIEKPFTKSVKEAELLLELADKKSLKIGVGHLFNFHPGIECITNFIKSSKDFDPYYFISNRVNLRPPFSKVDVIWDLAVHDFAVINYLFQEYPSSIFATATSFNGKGLFDMGLVQLTYSGNKKAFIHVGWHSPNRVRKFELYGSNWSIFFDDMSDQKVMIYDQGIDDRIGTGHRSDQNLQYKTGTVLAPVLRDIQPLLNECQSFVEYVEGNGTFRNDGYNGYWVVRMCEMTEQSVAINKEIKF